MGIFIENEGGEYEKIIQRHIVWLGACVHCSAVCCLCRRSTGRNGRIQKKYLTVTPPTGWEIEKQSSGAAGFMTGMLDSGIVYVRTGTMSGVVICPVFNLDELSAEWKEAEPDSFRSGRCLIQGGNDMILIMAPLKKDKKGQNGAMFIIMDEEASGAEKILQNALPLLRLFTHFDLSEAILEGKV